MNSHVKDIKHRVSATLRSLLTFDSLRLDSCRVDRSRIPAEIRPHTRIINYFGQDVAFCSLEHGGRSLSPDQLEPYRMVGDPPMDDLLQQMDHAGCPLKAGDDLFSPTNPYPPDIQMRLDAILQTHSTLPPWVDTAQLQRGQKVFLRYLPAASISLYYRSLVAGFSIPKIAAVVQATAYLAPPSTPEQVAYRIVDTGALVSSCMRDLDLWLPGAEAWNLCWYVRVLHAKVRRSLLRRTGTRTWNTTEYGIPINQEDMAATLLAFSLNTLKGIEFVSGVDISRAEQEDYIALWRYIGWLLGVSTTTDIDSNSSAQLRPLDPCGPGWNELQPDAIAHGTSLLQSIILHLLKPDKSSVLVSHHLLKIGRPVRRRDDGEVVSNKDRVAKQAAATPDVWFYFRSRICRSFIGDPLADALELPLHPVFHTRLAIHCAVYLYLWIFRCITWCALWEMGSNFFEGYSRKMLAKFHAIWTERHPSRMAQALQTESPCCPFAMVTRQD
jgi:ER-bound oxygenase mpaB/B'/Rubber oxygenase, catalytic domain